MHLVDRFAKVEEGPRRIYPDGLQGSSREERKDKSNKVIHPTETLAIKNGKIK